MRRPIRLPFSAVALAALLLPVPIAAAEASAPAFHARRPGDAQSPPATIDRVAWLAGRWVGDGLGGVSEETWSPPAGGAMMGTYRLLKDGAPAFHEMFLLVEENGSLILKSSTSPRTSPAGRRRRSSSTSRWSRSRATPSTSTA